MRTSRYWRQHGAQNACSWWQRARISPCAVRQMRHGLDGAAPAALAGEAFAPEGPAAAAEFPPRWRAGERAGRAGEVAGRRRVAGGMMICWTILHAPPRGARAPRAMPSARAHPPSPPRGRPVGAARGARVESGAAQLS